MYLYSKILDDHETTVDRTTFENGPRLYKLNYAFLGLSMLKTYNLNPIDYSFQFDQKSSQFQ